MMYGDWYEHQGHPHHIHGDMEPAFVVRPGDDCCPDPTAQQCECVTSGDIERWNAAADTVDGMTGIDITAAAEALTSITALNASAGYWNSAYNTVLSNSADWEHIRDLSSFSADTTAHLADIDESLSSLNTDIQFVSAAIPELFFDNDPWSGSITGNGTQGAPYGVKNYTQYRNIRTDLDDVMTHIRIVPSADGEGVRYIFDGDVSYLEKIENEYQNLTNTVIADHATKIKLHDREIAELWRSKAAGDDIYRYLGSDTITVTENPGAERGHEYSIHVTDVPQSVKNLIKDGTDALRRVKLIEQKRYVEFVKTKKPSTTADLNNLTAYDTIYYC